jgi:hypothetical protein
MKFTKLIKFMKYMSLILIINNLTLSTQTIINVQITTQKKREWIDYTPFFNRFSDPFKLLYGSIDTDMLSQNGLDQYLSVKLDLKKTIEEISKEWVYRQKISVVRNRLEIPTDESLSTEKQIASNEILSETLKLYDSQDLLDKNKEYINILCTRRHRAITQYKNAMSFNYENIFPPINGCSDDFLTVGISIMSDPKDDSFVQKMIVLLAQHIYKYNIENLEKDVKQLKAITNDYNKITQNKKSNKVNCEVNKYITAEDLIIEMNKLREQAIKSKLEMTLEKSTSALTEDIKHSKPKKKKITELKNVQNVDSSQKTSKTIYSWKKKVNPNTLPQLNKSSEHLTKIIPGLKKTGVDDKFERLNLEKSSSKTESSLILQTPSKELITPSFEPNPKINWKSESQRQKSVNYFQNNNNTRNQNLPVLTNKSVHNTKRKTQ